MTISCVPAVTYVFSEGGMDPYPHPDTPRVHWLSEESPPVSHHLQYVRSKIDVHLKHRSYPLDVFSDQSIQYLFMVLTIDLEVQNFHSGQWALSHQQVVTQEQWPPSHQQVVIQEQWPPSHQQVVTQEQFVTEGEGCSTPDVVCKNTSLTCHKNMSDVKQEFDAGPGFSCVSLGAPCPSLGACR
ncbi:hypothetical protein J6590_010073 [Homalodisca vitripennis]|nr:hypothetical protein J6590_010073 [Homalodisca vitripennis]